MPELNLVSHFAKEGVDPLTSAFEGKNIVHGGMDAGESVEPHEHQDEFCKLLAKGRSGKSVAYIHVPFCETHCLYCGFYRKRYDKAQSKQYADTLIKELQMHGDSPAQNTGSIHAVYFGGGTPTSLEASDLKRITQAARKYLPLANDCEITVEGRIRNFGAKKIEACLAGGVNRFSIGVQTFQTELRQQMQRLSAGEEAAQALTRLNAYDEAAVVIDLIYGFPTQTMDMWLEDIAIYQSLELDGVDLYQLKIFQGTPLFLAIEKGKIPAGLDTPTKARLYAAGADCMEAEFYRQLSVNHWGRTARERNFYNSGAKGPAHCLAFGPGAGGTLHGYFYFLQSDYGQWKEAITEGNKPVMMLRKAPSNSQLLKSISSELELCRINLRSIGEQFNCEVEGALRPLYTQWAKAGLLRRQGEWDVLTRAGQFWATHLVQHTNALLKKVFCEEKVA